MIRAVLFDRDGTLVENVPYNGDPERVAFRPGAFEAIGRLRAKGLALGVVTNQSAIGRGLITNQDASDVASRIDAHFGAFDVWTMCPHAPWDGCECRKPKPGLIHAAAADLGLPAAECCVVGDSSADYRAAEAAGAAAILVPTPATTKDVVESAPAVATDLVQATEMILRMQSGTGTGD